MSWIASSAHCLEAKGRDFSVEALAEVLPQHWINEALESCGVATKRRRKLSCGMTVWLTILLALFRRYSYVNLLEMVRGGFCTPDRWAGESPPCSSALSKARDRVGIAPLKHLYQRSAASWIESGGSLWFRGHRVVAIDGFTLKTWDSDENRSHFGVPGSSRGTTAFPQLRVVGCVDVGTRIMESMRYGPYSNGELGSVTK